VLATLLGRFCFELAPSMGKVEQVRSKAPLSLCTCSLFAQTSNHTEQLLSGAELSGLCCSCSRVCHHYGACICWLLSVDGCRALLLLLLPKPTGAQEPDHCPDTEDE
jgi:hypothetical protein